MTSTQHLLSSCIYTTRKIKAINIPVFTKDIQCAFQDVNFTDLTPESSLHLYNKTLPSTLDKYAPLIIKAMSNRQWIQWFNISIAKEIRSRLSPERAWIKDKSNSDKYLEFYHEQRKVAYLLQSAEREYDNDLLHYNHGNFKVIFNICDSLLGRKKGPAPSTKSH